MRPTDSFKKRSNLLQKHLSLVVGLAVVATLGVAMLIHQGVIFDTKKPPRPSPAPKPAIEVQINSSRKPSVTPSAPKPAPRVTSAPSSSRSSSRPQSVRLDSFPAERRGQAPVVPVIVERRRSTVVITQAPTPQQGADSGIPAVQPRKEPRKAPPAAADGVLPFFAPPDAPEGGIKGLIEGTSQANIQGALQAYIRTHYPLVTLDAESIRHLNPEGKAEYERQKAAFDKEISDVLRGSISPTPGEIDSGYPQELMDLLKKGDQGN
ncbi:MAG: hypothetical protein OXT74_19390 [Candidatus Poribacteria bacterium]|nr:hypothetical protein [Candidatus Poribacteria bacterium]